MRTLLACALVLCVAAPAAAQKGSAPATRVQGKLDAVAPDSTRVPRVVHQFRAARGQYIEVSVGSGDFDTVLGLITPRGDTLWNDDLGAETNSRITTVAVDEGTWNVVVNSYGEGGGSYELSVLLGEIGVVRDLAEGELADGDSTSIKGFRYDVHQFRVERLAGLMLQVSARGFAPSVIVVSPEGARFVSELGPEGGTSVSVIIPDAAPGNWRVMITHALEDAAQGTYSVQVVETNAAGTLETRNGELTTGDQQHLFGEYFDTHRIRASAHGEWVIELESEAFDAYLAVRSPAGQWFRNDDNEVGVNSILTLPPGDGNWTVIVTTAIPREVGAYKLTIRRPRAGSTPQP